jgi:hypothetical protein
VLLCLAFGRAGGSSAWVAQVSRGLQTGEVNSECLEDHNLRIVLIYLQVPVSAFTIRVWIMSDVTTSVTLHPTRYATLTDAISTSS